MCILFSYISRAVRPNEFKLVVLSNRDEYFHRPSRAADFITDSNIYGIDLTTGKEGGTWLGLSKSGKVSALLNLDSNKYGNDPNKEGRGFLVPNYLNSGLDFGGYLEPIKSNADKYNPFLLLGYEKVRHEDRWSAFVFDSLTAKVNPIESEFLSISNHLYDQPYKKTVVGEAMFKDVIAKFNKVDMKEELVKSLLELARYDANLKLTPDMTKSDVGEMMRSQVFINVPNYGTRTHTVILVDSANRVTFRETTMKSPIEQEPVWLEKSFEFNLH